MYLCLLYFFLVCISFNTHHIVMGLSVQPRHSSVDTNSPITSPYQPSASLSHHQVPQATYMPPTLKLTSKSFHQ